MEVIFDISENLPKVDEGIKIYFRLFSNNPDKYYATNYSLCIDGKIVGSVMFNKIGDKIIKLYCLEIFEPYQNLGYGKTLLKEIEKWCKSNNKTEIRLAVRRNNTLAIKLYKDFGFETSNPMDKYSDWNMFKLT